VMEFERQEQRLPKDVHEGKSWDIESYDAQGKVVRFIEVKGRGPEKANEVLLTNPEWKAAQRLEELHWLYIVRLEDRKIWTIPNPHETLKAKEIKHWQIKLSDLDEFIKDY
jgi:hypothetical protein